MFAYFFSTSFQECAVLETKNTPSTTIMEPSVCPSVSPSIRPSIICNHLPLAVGAVSSPSWLWARAATPWIGCQFIPRLVHKHHSCPSSPTGNLELPVNLTCMPLDSRRSQSTQREPAQARQKHVNSTNAELELKNLLLWGSSTNHCTMAPTKDLIRPMFQNFFRVFTCRCPW